MPSCEGMNNKLEILIQMGKITQKSLKETVPQNFSKFQTNFHGSVFFLLQLFATER